ncbi:MAG TPA: pyridoxamine 5'-phosphate oxidase family protein [Actinospica sp.]|jgi:hypothetical protein|nr:pyridoxamine 5'-phosphate oxidase family protein [Actinospica sp.]
METMDPKPLSVLSEAECAALLATAEVGRLVYTRHALPAVTPVNFVLRNRAVWIWTASTTAIWQAVRDAVVAFEVDELDPVGRTGWSVVVLGTVELVRDPLVLEYARFHGPEPWVAGRKDRLLRIPLTSVSGRRIGPLDDAGEGGALARVSDGSPLAEGTS